MSKPISGYIIIDGGLPQRFVSGQRLFNVRPEFPRSCVTQFATRAAAKRAIAIENAERERLGMQPNNPDVFRLGDAE